MKVFLTMLLCVVAGFAFTGCETDMPPKTNTDNPLQRGLRGEGALTQPDRSDDPLIREQTRTGN